MQGCYYKGEGFLCCRYVCSRQRRQEASPTATVAAVLALSARPECKEHAMKIALSVGAGSQSYTTILGGKEADGSELHIGHAIPADVSTGKLGET